MSAASSSVPVFNPLWMQIAFAEAKTALAEGEVPIGAVFLREEHNGVEEVKEEHILAKGGNEVNK